MPATTLTHRYSFDADASDSISGADGTLEGSAFVTNGALVLQGTNSGVQLPTLFTNYNSVSVELWFEDGAVNNPYTPLYGFSGLLENGSQQSMTYELGGRASWTEYGLGTEYVTLPVPAVAGEVHLVWTLDNPAHTARLYVNGILTSQYTDFPDTTAKIGPTSHNYIAGAGSGAGTTADSFQGRISEFRIYQGALSPLQVAVSDAAGPDEVPSDPGAVRSVHLIAPPPTGPGALVQAKVYADFANVTNVNISSLPDLTLSSDNTNVIVISPDPRLGSVRLGAGDVADQLLHTVGIGIADITASYRGVSNTIPISVAIPPDVELIHRYSFSEPTNAWVVHDSVGDADGSLALPLNGQLPMSGLDWFSGMGKLNTLISSNQCYVTLPPALISCLSSVSIGAWVTWSSGLGSGYSILGTAWPTLSATRISS